MKLYSGNSDLIVNTCRSWMTNEGKLTACSHYSSISICDQCNHYNQVPYMLLVSVIHISQVNLRIGQHNLLEHVLSQLPAPLHLEGPWTAREFPETKHDVSKLNMIINLSDNTFHCWVQKLTVWEWTGSEDVIPSPERYSWFAERSGTTETGGGATATYVQSTSFLF